MKHQKVDKFGYFYEVIPKQYRGKVGRPKKDRVCSFEECENKITYQTFTGFCNVHRQSKTKSKVGVKPTKAFSLKSLKIGDTCTKCNYSTIHKSGLCGRCNLKKFIVSHSKPKAPFTRGGLKELEEIVALENKVSQRKTSQQEALPLKLL